MAKYIVKRTISVDPISVQIEVEANSPEEASDKVENAEEWKELDVDLQDVMNFQEEVEEVE